MRIKNISLAMLATVFAASCSNEQIVETNADPTGEAIDFRPSVASQTRAVVTTITNLGDFNVFAKGIRADHGNLYKTLMVGDEKTETSNAKPALASKISSSTESGMWKLSKDVYWPSDINTALFWAFSDRRDGEGNKDGLCVTTGSIDFLETFGPQIINYKPLKADLTQPADKDDTGWFDGDHQRDLVSAFTQQTKNPHVNLKFHHLLSQIEINAFSKHAKNDDESRKVKIKGAWLVNIYSTGSLNANYKYNKDTQTATDNPIWTHSGDLEQYGSIYSGNDRTVPTAVNATSGSLNILGNEGHGNLMLIPQNNIDNASWNGTSETTTGSYLLLLCRVDLGHKGTVVDGSVVSPTIDGIHYHQQFPITSYYDEDAYGLTAIPVPVNWEIGKKYTYNLDICGENSGAGMYPPNVPTESDQLAAYLAKFIPGTLGTDYVINATEKPNPTKTNIITTRQSGKVVGDYVLDDPIQFEVTVSDWADGGTWTNGSEQKNNAVIEE